MSFQSGVKTNKINMGFNGREIKKTPFKRRFINDFKENKYIYLMMVPVIAFFILFCYVPMYGIFFAFFDYVPALGFAESEFVGFQHFSAFFNSYYIKRIIKNTFMLNVWDVIFCFPAPILFAILLFEIGSKGVKKSVQFVSYLPYFISLVVVCGLIREFTLSDGFVTNILTFFGLEKQNLLDNPSAFYTIYIISNIWQVLGFNSIIYYVALCTINTSLFEAARIDGAGRLKTLIYITMPSIMPTVIVMFIMRMGNLFNVGFEKSYLLMTPLNKEASEVIATHVYERGIRGGNYGYGTAVGLFNALINFACLFITNLLAKKTGNSLW